MNRPPQLLRSPRLPRLLPLLGAVLLGFGLSACSSTGGSGGAVPVAGASAVTPAAARLAADVATMSALSFGAQTDADRARAALYVQSVAGAVRSLSGGQAPSVAQFDAAIRLWAPQADPVFGRIAAELAGVYGSYYPAITADGRAGTVLTYLEAIATGVEDAARPYLVATDVFRAPGPPSPWLPLAAVGPIIGVAGRREDEAGSLSGTDHPAPPGDALPGVKVVTPGPRTTEFWLSALTTAASLIGMAAGVLPPKYGAIAAAISSGLYAVSRGLAKLG